MVRCHPDNEHCSVTADIACSDPGTTIGVDLCDPKLVARITFHGPKDAVFPVVIAGHI